MSSDKNKLDIFVYIKILWKEKLLITFFTIIPILVSYIYYIKSENFYEYKISFNIDIEKFITYRHYNICDLVCKKKYYFTELSIIIDENIALNEKYQIVYKSNDINDLNEIYLNLKNKANNELTKKILDEAIEFQRYKDYLRFIPSKIYYGNIIENFEYNKLLIHLINENRKIFIFQEPILTKLPNRKISLFLFTLFLSPILSSFIIYLKGNFRSLFK